MNLKYRVEFSSNSKKQLKKYDKNTIKRIISSIESLTESPYNHPHSKRMKGIEGNIYRLRVGDFRIIYEIFDNKVLIFIIKIGSRGDIYK